MTSSTTLPNTGMSAATVEAIRLAQQRCLATTSATLVHRLELALDELVRHPDSVGDPLVLLDNALANARTKLRRRAEILAIRYSSIAVEYADATYPVALSRAAPTGDTMQFDVSFIEAADALARAPLTVDDRILLLYALADLSAEQVGQQLEIPAQRARERLSRARAHARGGSSLRADLIESGNNVVVA